MSTTVPNSYDAPLWQMKVHTQASQPRGLYVAVSGNTGSGKSTLLRSLGERIAKTATVIDERVLHHPWLDAMFYDPAKYAFGIQLNFLVQRHLALAGALSASNVVLIERSHLDDVLFVEELAQQGSIRDAEREAYLALHAELTKRIGLPDLLVLVDADPMTSLMRIREGELSGLRSEEFPSEAVKERFVRDWHNRYQQLHDDWIASSKSDSDFARVEIVDCRTIAPLEDRIRRVEASFAWSSLMARGTHPPR